MEMNQTYNPKKSPKVMLAALPEMAGTSHRDEVLQMGATIPSAKPFTWAGIPMQSTVHEMLASIAYGQREFGCPGQVKLWRSLSMVMPSVVDNWIVDKYEQSFYRPLEDTAAANGSNKFGTTSKMIRSRMSSHQSVSGKTWT
jgi:hypothetical protein